MADINLEKDETAFKDIDYKNKTIAKSMPDKVPGLDTDDAFYSMAIEAAQSDKLDINTINAFSNISKSRDQVYNLLDMMGEDPIISSALEIYASDACEPNDAGQIVWCESDDENVLGACNMILDELNVDKNTYNWMYSFIKYGDLYLRLFRNSEYDDNKVVKEDEKTQLHESYRNVLNDEKLNEDVILKIYSKNDKYAGYAEAVKNPAEVFDLTRFGKSYGYLRTHIQTTNPNTSTDMISQYSQFSNQMNYHFNRNDVDVYEATEFVHASLDDNSDRVEEEVSIFDGDGDNQTQTNFKVKRGQSILYNSFKIWRELSLLENSVLLNRLTKSSIVRTVNVEVGDMEKDAARNLLGRIKQMIEQKSAINTGKSIREYTNPGPMENVIYIPTHEGKGTITASQIGGDVNVGDLSDLDYWKKKLFASLGIPGQYLGDTDDNTGFNGGSSLSLISSRYAKNIKRIQNAYVQAITDAINLILLDMGLKDYIGEFTIRMQAPTTQEEKDRKDNMSTALNNVDATMRLMDNVEDPKLKLKMLKSLLSSVVSDQEVLTALQDQIDELEEGSVPTEESGENDDLSGGSDILDISDFENGGSNGNDLPTPEENGSEPLDLENEAPEGEEPNESFYTNSEGEILTEADLPSFSDLGVNGLTYRK